MRAILIASLLGLLPLHAMAELWQFDQVVDVTAASDESTKFFHHLDSSGRRNIAATAAGVALAWEDDRDGVPRIYLAFKTFEESAFGVELQISGGGEAYEPSIIPLGDKRLLVAWEEEGQVIARSVTVGARVQLGKPLQLSEATGSQVSLIPGSSGAFALWSEREERFGRIRLSGLSVDEQGAIKRGKACYVDPQPATDEQLYPSGVVAGQHLVVAWEDRRPKHTIIMAASAKTETPCGFTPAARISYKPEENNLPFGTGHGVSRVAVGRFGDDGAFAAWADKRSFRDGYDIWGAVYQPDKQTFPTNEKVQDDFSGLSKQRYASIDGLANGMLVVVWSDEREGHADLMLSWREEGEWSDDWPIPVASGEGHQSNPSFALDSQGNLHVAWVERDSLGGVTRLKYAQGRYQSE